MAKVGRKSKLDTINFKQVELLAGLGLKDTEIAIVLEISEASLNNYKNHPKFLESLKNGKLKSDKEVVKSLYKRALGYSFTETHTKTNSKGKVKEKEVITKEVLPDVTAQIFWLKNRRPDIWRDKTDIEHSLSDSTVEKFATLSVTELLSKANALIGKTVKP